MTGLSRFDFYPRDWFLSTRNLSLEARAVYVDMIAAMYDLGGPIEADGRYLCTLCGIKSVRPLRRIIKELLDKEKIYFIHTPKGKLIGNRRALREIEAAHQRMENGRRGGRPPTSPNGPSSGELSGNFDGSLEENSPKLQGRNHLNQGHSPNTPPPPEDNGSFANAQEPADRPPTGGDPPGSAKVVELADHLTDPQSLVFGAGLRMLIAHGKREDQARRILGGWCKEFGDASVVAALIDCRRHRPADPLPWIKSAMQRAAGTKRAGSNGRPPPDLASDGLPKSRNALRITSANRDTWHDEAYGTVPPITDEERAALGLGPPRDRSKARG